MSEHEYWEELAAGYALNALEPAEEEVFTSHLADCSLCQAVLTDHVLVAAQLGSLVEGRSDTPSWERISTIILPTHPVTSLAEVRHRRRAPHWLAAAAGLALVAAGGTLWLARSNDERSPQQVALSSCTSKPSCHVVQLQGKGSLVVASGAARLLASRLPAPPAGQVYVLWQLPRDGSPTVVGTLHETADGTVGESHALPLAYEDTAAFGLSLERSDTVPTRPSKVIALGPA
jgi:anti-sigma-K factor RskA